MTASYENVLEELVLCLAGFSGDVFLEPGADAAGAAAGCERRVECCCMHNTQRACITTMCVLTQGCRGR